MKRNDLPFEILETHISEEGIVLHIRSDLTEVETYAVYPEATKEDLKSRKIFSRQRWSATFSPDAVGRHLALHTLKIYREITDGINLRLEAGMDNPDGFLEDEFHDPRKN